MAITPTALPATVFSPVTAAGAGQPESLVANLTPTLVAPATDAVNAIVATIQQAISSNAAANAPSTTANTPLPPPNNFSFEDLSVNVSGATPGDAFKGTTPGITAQFLDLTPDNLLIQATGPNTFMRSDTGNDILAALSGRNILSAGSGLNTMIGGSGQDTFLADATKASASATILNFGSTDDVAILGPNLTNSFLSMKDTLTGLEIDAAPAAPAAVQPAPLFPTTSAQITLQGYTVADIGTKLTLGVGTATDGTSFLFLHGN